jgi:phosphoribosylglycinamide formyltransferase-1
MCKPKLLVFASGSAEGGGSGFENLVHKSRDGTLDADVVAVVSHHQTGGVERRAAKLGIPFVYFQKPWSEIGYRVIAQESGADFFALSGWLKHVSGLDPRSTFNIHAGPLLLFGGPGMYGHRVHEAVIAAFRAGEVTRSAVCMHFVTLKYDRGPCFFRCWVPIREDDTPDTLAARVNKCEHLWQPRITNLVVHGKICWSGITGELPTYPHGYQVEHAEV